MTLVQEIDSVKQPGFLIYVPAYRGPSETLEQRRQNLIGFAYSPLRGRDLFNGIFAVLERAACRRTSISRSLMART